MNGDRSGRRSHLQRLKYLPAEYPVATAGVFVLVASAFFVAFPGVDLWVSHLFYGGEGEFPLRRNDMLRLLRSTTYPLVAAIVGWLVIHIVLKLARPDTPSFVPPSVSAFLLSTLIVGPGLLVNALLKEFWGRPRPHEIGPFGGEAPYVPVWEISAYCQGNCSFVSGETSVAVWLIAVALVVPLQIRTPALIATGIYAALVSFNRILFGGHFLSDVLLSAGLTLLVIAVGYRLFIHRPPALLANERLEAGLTRLGRRLSGPGAGAR